MFPARIFIAIMDKKLVLAAAAAALFSVNTMAQAQEGPWLVRARAVHLDSANNDKTGLDLSINNKWLPEVDISYFITPQIAAELILTVPQKHDVYSSGTKIGSLRHLPPTLTAQYHFAPSAEFRPYVGAGLNYTRFSSVHLPTGVTADNHSYGPALQAGIDIPIAKNIVFNVDVKKVYIHTHIKAAGVDLGKFNVDPVLFGVGVGYRF
jgi:outer membrane protein